MPGIQRLAPLRLLLHALVINVVSYAFQGIEDKTIAIKSALKINRVSFVFADNEVGISASVDLTDSTGFGM